MATKCATEHSIWHDYWMLETVTPKTFRVRRLGLWLPAALFFGLSVIVFAGAPSLGTRLFYAVMTGLTGAWLLRSSHVSVATNESGVTVRGMLRTRRFPWTTIDGASLVSMRTASPFASHWPYVALALRLSDGRMRRFDEVSSSASKQSVVSAIVEHINEWRR
jgi:Bacterial PH domain